MWNWLGVEPTTQKRVVWKGKGADIVTNAWFGTSYSEQGLGRWLDVETRWYTNVYS